MPAIIGSHGYGGTHAAVTAYAEAMAARGYVFYAFDFRGGSTARRSDGSTLDMTLFTEEDDLTTVMDTVRGLDFVDEDKPLPHGH